MFIGEEAACRLHPIGVPCSGLVSQQNMAHLRSASGSGCRIYKHCTPTEWDSLLTHRSVLHTKG
jgi:hypothetical protein